MCAICKLLDTSFPTPKQLARTYIEVLDANGIEQSHYEDLEAKMFDSLATQGMSAENETLYKNEFLREYYLLMEHDF